MSKSSKSDQPKSVKDYVNGIEGALPKGVIRERLKRLRLFSPAEARPGHKEFLYNWHHSNDGDQKGRFPLTVVVGETDSIHRDTRQNAPHSGKMTMAKTCDGVFGARAAVGLMRTGSMNLAEVDFDAVVDEWPESDERLANSNLLVIGSPEVTTCAAFLHGLVADFYFGSSEWPPDVKGTGGTFNLEGKGYGRNPSDGRQFHDGCIFLLKNPWNPDYRLLWIAGVSGRGTGFGCSLICNNWQGHEQNARKSIGVVFRREMKNDAFVSEQFAWLLPRRNGLTWKSTLDEESHVASPERFHVFLSHNSKDKSVVCDLKKRLALQNLRVWYDEDEILPGMSSQEQLEKGIRSSTSVAVIVGKDGLGPWQDEEMQGALRLAVKCKCLVIPVLLPGAPSEPELPMFLTSRAWVDLRGGITAEGITKLVWGINGKKT